MANVLDALLKFRFLASIGFNKLLQTVSRILPRDQVTVVLDQGTLIGQKHTTLLSKKPYARFLGVPYAKPPVNELRFKPPVDHPGWTGELKAFSEGNRCVQYFMTTNKIVGSEDCLYLNIFVPQDVSNGKKAVMLFIHGGAFHYGSGSCEEFSPDYLLDENVVVVTINYRLNIFGFLNFDIDDCPGNMGLKDQLLAIKWTKKNISAFDGDPDNITIFGQSAGSVSVHYHTLSPQSKGTFQKAIMHSGGAFYHWALNKKHKEAAYKLSKKLGCNKDDPQEIVQYLKDVPAIDLVKGAKIENDLFYNVYEFIPSIESSTISNPFLSALPEVLAKTSSTVPIIAGITDVEGLIALGLELKNANKIFDNFHKPQEMINFFKDHYSEENVYKIIEFYFKDHDIKSELVKLENICDFYSDLYFTRDFHRSFDYILKQNTTPVYNYSFKFDGEINYVKNLSFITKPSLRKPLKGACHGDELSYLFYMELFRFAPKPDSPEHRMCKTMSKLWSNFAKTGSPNSPDLSVEWKNTSLDDPKFLSIDGDNTKMVDGLLCKSKVQFWESLAEPKN